MYTVLSAFDAREAAQRAVELLVKEGFPRENIHLQTDTAKQRVEDERVTADALASPEREIAVGTRAASAVDRFFDRLLGRGQHAAHARTYSEAVRRGSVVVVVDTSSEVAASRAATVVQESGAYDIAERSEQWQRDGWSGAAATGARQLAGGGTLHWRTAHVIHRPSQPRLSEVIGGRHEVGE